MRILVTGASGFSGRTVARLLRRTGHDVVAHFHTTPLPEDLADGETWRADLGDGGTVPSGLDAVVHTAAVSPVTGKKPAVPVAALVRANALATAELATADVPFFIYLSSLSVHGRIGQARVTPATPIVDPDAYGASKLMGEMALASRNRSTVALRLPAVIGAGAARNWPSHVLARLKAGEAVSVFNPDSPFNNVVHVEDLAEFVLHLLEAPPSGFRAFPLASRDPIPVHGVVSTLAEGAGVQAKVETRNLDRVSFSIDIVEAEELGFAPRSTTSALRDYATEESS